MRAYIFAAAIIISTPCLAQSGDDYQAGGWGPQVHPHGGANGGLCFGPACGDDHNTGNSDNSVGPQVHPHGGANGGLCFGPACGD